MALAVNDNFLVLLFYTFSTLLRNAILSYYYYRTKTRAVLFQQAMFKGARTSLVRELILDQEFTFFILIKYLL